MNMQSAFDGQQNFKSVEELKSGLSIIYVLADFGVDYENVSGKHMFVCPFHDDTKASLEVYGETLSHSKCLACGAGGDVFDIVGKLYNIGKADADFTKKKDKAAQLLDRQVSSGWVGPTKGDAPSSFNREVNETLLTNSQGIQQSWIDLYTVLASKSPAIYNMGPEWIHETFELASDGARTAIPYYAVDDESPDGRVLGAMKFRVAGEPIKSGAGSTFKDLFYGEWLDTDPSKTVILCEGESDTWVASRYLPDYVALGLPTGVGSHPKQAPKLAGRNVVLAFDGDDAGRSGLRTWYAALLPIARSVRIAVMPDGKDVCTVDSIAVTVAKSVMPVARQNRISVQPGSVYTVPVGEREPEALSNFGLTALRQLKGDGFDAWDCYMLPQERNVIITMDDLDSKSALVSWAKQHSGTWYGSDNHAQLLKAHLLEEDPFISKGNIARIAGLNGDHFVFPGGQVGPDKWAFKPDQKVDMATYTQDLMNSSTGLSWKEEFTLLQGMGDPRVIDPLLAWLALAPLRSLISPFPTLAVLGGAGSGKTTLLTTFLKRFTGTEIMTNLTNTTRFALTALSASTNAFPVWFDEYRQGGRTEALEAVNQIVRDAYDGNGSLTGGGSSGWDSTKVFRSECPMIVSGEDAFTETSHVDRIVPLYLPKADNSNSTFGIVKNLPLGSFAYDTLRHTRELLINGDVTLVAEPVDIDGTDRMAYNLGVLNIGWELLSRHAEDLGGFELRSPDWSLVLEGWAADSKTDPVLDAIGWAWTEEKAHEFMWKDNDPEFFHVRVTNFLRHVKVHGDMIMPGNKKAVDDLLIKAHGGVKARPYYRDKQPDTIKLPYSLITKGN